MATSGQQGNVKHPETDGRLKENRESGRTMGTTPGSRERQEKGGHSSAEEKQGSQASGQHGGGGGAKGNAQESQGGGGDDMKSREYKDADGNVHHHTRTYMEQHKDEK